MYKVVVISSFHEQGLALLRRDDIELHVVDDFHTKACPAPSRTPTP